MTLTEPTAMVDRDGAPRRHQQFYYEDGNVVFLVDGVLFKVECKYEVTFKRLIVMCLVL